MNPESIQLKYNFPKGQTLTYTSLQNSVLQRKHRKAPKQAVSSATLFGWSIESTVEETVTTSNSNGSANITLTTISSVLMQNNIITPSPLTDRIVSSTIEPNGEVTRNSGSPHGAIIFPQSSIPIGGTWEFERPTEISFWDPENDKEERRPIILLYHCTLTKLETLDDHNVAVIEFTSPLSTIELDKNLSQSVRAKGTLWHDYINGRAVYSEYRFNSITERLYPHITKNRGPSTVTSDFQFITKLKRAVIK